MSFDFRFHPVESRKDLLETLDFLYWQDLGYPNYRQIWVPKVEADFLLGKKKIILARNQGRVVGDLVYQQHPQIPRIRELKNLRVHPKAEERAVATFLLKQAEKEERQEYDVLLVDARETETKTIAFMHSRGYRKIAVQSLYEPDKKEVIMAKSFKPEFDLSKLAA